MIEFTPFNIEHLRYVSPQAEQRYEHSILLNTEYGRVINDNFGISGWVGHKCIGAMGVVPVYGHRGYAWAVLSQDAAPYMVPIVRKVRKALALMPYRRIETTVRHDFEDGHRFVRMVGMRCETPEPLRAHGADGSDEMLYAVVR